MTTTPDRWVIQTLLANGEWETVGEDPFYATKEDAETELQDHIKSCEQAVRDGDMTDFNPEDWRVHHADR